MFAIDEEFALLCIVVDSAVEAAVHGVILQHVSHVFNRKEVVYGNYFNVVTFGGSTEHKAADATETIDTNLGHNLIVYKV